MSWRKCNLCKKSIGFGATYWNCSVSTCNRRRLQLHFCSVSCYDAHLPGMNHRESWAVEIKAPSQNEWSDYVKDQGEDAVWPPVKKDKPPEEEQLPSGGFGGGGSAKAGTVIRRKKP